MDKPIYVTQPSLPALEEFIPYLEKIWESKILTNNGPMHKQLEKELADKRLRLSTAGNIAEAALEMNDCFRSAQNAAEHYLQEIKTMRDETQAECMQILTATRAEAERIIATAQRKKGDYDCAVEAILNEYKKNHWDNG